MKNKKYIGFLLIEAVALLALSFSETVKKESIFSVLSVPLTFIADNLGKLSSSGAFGNTVSVIIYSLICLIPVFVMLFKISKKTFLIEDSVLVTLSAVLFPLIYFLINPAEMGAFGLIKGESETVCFAFWSVLGSYLILKFTASLQKADSGKLQTLLSLVLKILGAVFVFAIFSTETETANSGLAGFVVNLFAFINTVAPNIFGVITVFSGLALLDNFAADRYSEETVKGAEKLSSLCILGVKVSVVISALFNIFQLKYIDVLNDVSFSLNVPLFSLGFILLMLIASSFIKDSKALKEDNDAFI